MGSKEGNEQKGQKGKDEKSAFAAKFEKRFEKKEFSGSKMNSSPSINDLVGLKVKNESGDFATEDMLHLIMTAWTVGLDVKDEHVFQTAFDIAWYCYHNGSSANMNPIGKCPNGVERAEAVAAIRGVCTLRQFCRTYANIVWAYAINQKEPPMHWQKWGYKEDVKFSAFDFFDAVGNEHSISPKGGLGRSPTEMERNANLAKKEIATVAANRKAGNNTIQTMEVTGGRSGCKPELLSLRRDG